MPLAGEIIDASDIIVPKYIKKAASQSVTSSITPVNDADLAVALPVGVWRVEARLTATGHATAGDLRVVWANTGTMSFLARSCLGPAALTTDATDGGMQSSGRSITTEVVYGVAGSTVAAKIWEDIFVNVTVAGTLTLQWAQGTSSGTATTLGTSSMLIMTQVEEY